VLLAKDVERIQRTYRVPSEVVIRIPKDGEPVMPCKDGETIVYEEMLKVGMSVPFHPFMRELLAKMPLSPGQTKSNRWCFIVSCCILWQMVVGRTLTAYQRVLP
jgi:hypothetical protein